MSRIMFKVKLRFLLSEVNFSIDFLLYKIPIAMFIAGWYQICRWHMQDVWSLQ